MGSDRDPGEERILVMEEIRNADQTQLKKIFHQNQVMNHMDLEVSSLDQQQEMLWEARQTLHRDPVLDVRDPILQVEDELDIGVKLEDDDEEMASTTWNCSSTNQGRALRILNFFGSYQERNVRKGQRITNYN